MKIEKNTLSTPVRSDLLRGLDFDQVRAVLLQAARAADQVTLPVFRSKFAIDNKEIQGFDPVTKADREAELVIRATIEQYFPDHGIIGEEHDNKIRDSDFTWVIDPIDGTRSFISGIPVWGTLIGLACGGKTIAGLMSQPFTGETYLGLPGEANLLRRGHADVPLGVSSVEKLEEAVLFTTDPYRFEAEQGNRFHELESKVRLSRYGCDCYAYGLLAGGHIDLVVENGLNIYDIAALIPIIEQAGGVITSFEGARADKGGDVVASATPALHEQALKIMGGAT